MTVRARVTFLVVVLCFCITAHAQMGQGKSQSTTTPAGLNTLTVVVRTAQNTPATNARVEVRDSAGIIVASGYTGQAGSLELAGYLGSSYEVIVTRGLSEARDQIQPRGGEAMVTLRLPAEQGSDVAGNGATISVAQYKVPAKAQKEYKKAEEAVDKSKLQEAAQHLAKALDIYPHYAQALCLRAIISMDGNHQEAAVTDLEHAIELDPSYPTSYFALGAVYNLMSRFDDALRTLDHGVTISPASWQGYFEIAKADIGKADYSAALRQLDRALGLARQNYPLIYLLKAHALISLKQYPEAMVALEAFLQKAPQDPQSDTARKMLAQAKTFAARE